MAIDLRSIFPSESITQYEAAQSGGWREQATMVCATSLALLIVAAIAVLMVMV
jgi:hypothetical protein